MGNAFESKPGSDRSWFAPRPMPAQSLHEDALAPASYGCTDGVRCDPRDPVHAQSWKHHLDEHIVGHVDGGPRLNTGLTKELTGEALGADVFAAGDWALAHGGQFGLDVLGLVPGVNVVTEGAQSAYHTAHALHDLSDGNEESAREESAEAGWHGASTLLNAFTLEGGNELKGARTSARAAHGASHLKHVVHDIHKVVDIGEGAWDLGSTAVRALGGSKEQLPFLGALVPWIANGAGREGDEVTSTTVLGSETPRDESATILKTSLVRPTACRRMYVGLSLFYAVRGVSAASAGAPDLGAIAGYAAAFAVAIALALWLRTYPARLRSTWRDGCASEAMVTRVWHLMFDHSACIVEHEGRRAFIIVRAEPVRGAKLPALVDGDSIAVVDATDRLRVGRLRLARE